ncbi:MAG: putative signal transducing protein [Betaproteobacteria bacterium]
MTKRHESNEPVTVLETGDQALLAVAKSLLEDAGIAYFAKGEGMQDLFGLGRFGTGFSPVVGPVELQVAADDAAEARARLMDLMRQRDR